MLRIVYRDIFNLKYFYLLLHEWFVDNSFVPDREDQKFPETMFIHRDFGTYNQMWWRWRFERDSPSGPLYRWNIDIDVHILGHKVVETVINGQKIKADNAEVEIFVTPGLYFKTSKWKDSPFLKQLQPVLTEFVYRKRNEEEIKLFEHTVWRCQEAIKTYFKLEVYLPERQSHEVHPHSDFTT